MSIIKLAPQTSAFASLWYKAQERANDDIPEKSDLPLRELAPLMPSLMMHRRDENGRPICTLFGTRLTELFGRDLTGYSVEDAMEVKDVEKRRASFETYFSQHGADAPFCRWVTGVFNSHAGLAIQYESLAFPYIELSDSSFRNIVHVLPLETLAHGDSIIPRFNETEAHIFHPSDPRPDWLTSET